MTKPRGFIWASTRYKCSQVTVYSSACVDMDMQKKAEKTKTTRAPETRPRYNSVVITFFQTVGQYNNRDEGAMIPA